MGLWACVGVRCCLRPSGVPAPRPGVECLLVLFSGGQVLTDATWAMSYLTDGTNDKIQACLDAGAGPLLIRLMSHGSVAVQTPALRAAGNIVTGNDGQTQVACVAFPTDLSVFRGEGGASANLGAAFAGCMSSPRPRAHLF